MEGKLERDAGKEVERRGGGICKTSCAPCTHTHTQQQAEPSPNGSQIDVQMQSALFIATFHTSCAALLKARRSQKYKSAFPLCTCESYPFGHRSAV